VFRSHAFSSAGRDNAAGTDPTDPFAVDFDDIDTIDDGAFDEDDDVEYKTAQSDLSFGEDDEDADEDVQDPGKAAQAAKTTKIAKKADDSRAPGVKVTDRLMKAVRVVVPAASGRNKTSYDKASLTEVVPPRLHRDSTRRKLGNRDS
jgi:hypothetical protein